jgi:hypothetical protein
LILGSVHVGFVGDKVALGQVFTPSTLVLPCQFHSTGAPLLGKIKKKTDHLSLHRHHNGCTISLQAAGPFSTHTKKIAELANELLLYRRRQEQRTSFASSINPLSLYK